MTAATPGRELLACPFCGYAAMTSGNPSDKYEPAINIHCCDCNVEGGWFYGVDCVDRATKHWNTRLAANPSSDPDAMNERRKPADEMRAEAYHECADIATRYNDCGGNFIAEKIRDAATAISTTGEPKR